MQASETCILNVYALPLLFVHRKVGKGNTLFVVKEVRGWDCAKAEAVLRLELGLYCAELLEMAYRMISRAGARGSVCRSSIHRMAW